MPCIAGEVPVEMVAKPGAAWVKEVIMRGIAVVGALVDHPPDAVVRKHVPHALQLVIPELLNNDSDDKLGLVRRNVGRLCTYQSRNGEEIYNCECSFHFDFYQIMNKPQKYQFWIYLQEDAAKISTRIIGISTG